MKKIFLISTLFLFFPILSKAQNNLEKFFIAQNVGGSITIYDHQKGEWIYSDENDAKFATQPASTFKIINSLIAIETGVINDENELIPWVGLDKVDTSNYGYRPDIYHDMNLKEAFEKSAVWVHLELAKKIGKERHQDYLKKCGYGNLDFSEPGTDFWNFGAFAITPVEQVNFLRKLYEGKLPFSKRALEIVKKIMITETGEDYIIRAKTGMAIDNNTSIGWWVGYIEKKGRIYFFATRIKINAGEFSMKFAQDRKDITKAVLKELKIIQ